MDTQTGWCCSLIWEYSTFQWAVKLCVFDGFDSPGGAAVLIMYSCNLGKDRRLKSNAIYIYSAVTFNFFDMFYLVLSYFCGYSHAVSI